MYYFTQNKKDMKTKSDKAQLWIVRVAIAYFVIHALIALMI